MEINMRIFNTLLCAVSLIALCACHSAPPAKTAEQQAAEAAALAATPQIEVLAKHRTLATYEGTHYRPCLGRTALCPKDCGSSGEFARFTIDKYVSFESDSPYAEKQKFFLVQVSDYYKNPVGVEALNQTISRLEKGDKVYLDWNHVYVTHDGMSTPAHPVVRLEKIMPAVEEPAAPQTGKQK